MHIKRGDTFSLIGAMPCDWPEGAWTVRAAVQDRKKVMHRLPVALAAVSNEVHVAVYGEAEITEKFAVGNAKFDIEFTDISQVPPYVISTTTVPMQILEDITV